MDGVFTFQKKAFVIINNVIYKVEIWLETVVAIKNIPTLR